MVKKYFCDICGREIESHQTVKIQLFHVRRNPATKKMEFESLAVKSIRHVDICRDCAKKVVEKAIKEIEEKIAKIIRE